ncbi:MAG: C10 family peptidase [Bacteroidales bacterium]
MTRIITLVSIMIIIGANSLSAGNVISERAGRVAKNFYYERINQYINIDIKDISIRNIIPEKKGGMTVYYGVNIHPAGFVIVSAEDEVVPVLGYSFEGEYSGENKPCNFSAWMEQHASAIEWIKKTDYKGSAVVHSEWERLLTTEENTLKKFNDQKSVEPLIISNWDQGKFYNTLCPADAAGPDGHALTGCVATAMGQIMYYYRWPEHGTGSYTYQHPTYGTLSADFSAATYDWGNMQNQLQSYNEGVAELLFHSGVSVDMNYGPQGSGMWNHHAALALGTYFNYLPGTQYVWRDTTDLDWDSLIISHLDRGQILYYAGWSDYQYISGHAFVCDGYQDTSYCHFNWGWSGSYNGYFYLNALNPGGSNFNLVQELIINIYPDTLQYTYPDYCTGSESLSYFNGTLEDGSGPIADYGNSQSCLWLLNPQVNPEDSISSITVTFQKFDTEAGQDILTLYDGETTNDPVLGTFSGNTLPQTLTSTGNKILITFNTNTSNTATGWFLSYKSNFPDYCGTTSLTDPQGDISDGSGTKHYLDNTLCTWSIQPDNAAQVKLTFTEFSTESVKDFVEVYDMNTSVSLGKFSGNQLPPEVTSPSGKMYIIFKTNGSNNSSGWAAHYSVTNLGIESASQDLGLEFFPNPVDTRIVFSLSGLPVRHFTYALTDISGRVIQQGDVRDYLGGDKVEIDVSGVTSGYYILKIISDKGFISRKISVI